MPRPSLDMRRFERERAAADRRMFKAVQAFVDTWGMIELMRVVSAVIQDRWGLLLFSSAGEATYKYVGPYGTTLYCDADVPAFGGGRFVRIVSDE